MIYDWCHLKREEFKLNVTNIHTNNFNENLNFIKKRIFIIYTHKLSKNSIKTGMKLVSMTCVSFEREVMKKEIGRIKCEKRERVVK